MKEENFDLLLNKNKKNEDTKLLEFTLGSTRQLNDILSCDDFWDSLKRQAEIVERALNEDDIFFDYGQVDTSE